MNQDSAISDFQFLPERENWERGKIASIGLQKMKGFKGSLVFGWLSRAGGVISTSSAAGPNCSLAKKPELLRFMTLKAPNRAAVHGHRLPIPRVVDEEEVEKVIEKGKEEKEKKRQEVEKVVDSHLKRSDLDTCPPPNAS